MAVLLPFLATNYLFASVPEGLDPENLQFVPSRNVTSRGDTVTTICGLVIPESCPWKALNTLAWAPNTPCPGPDEPYKQLDIFKRTCPPGEGKIAIHNYCEYDLFVEPHSGNERRESFVIPASGVKIEEFFPISCPGCGNNYKVSKTKDMHRPVQIEYAQRPDGLVSFDISLIDCLGPSRNDPTGCAGHEAGLQLGGNENCTRFQCEAGKWCDDQAYFYQENFCKTNNPVGACHADDGLVMEFCAKHAPRA